ncbi:glycosyltransferase family 61 protein [Actibacterium ureilyticum]|uniref:glycosyltransferase family 61 protein n=1 Tax=Actibacterium ureilyticum TaxID=1590614 RepID=UPI000BAAFF53|nr:glycosyltransferase 61 family protein [Actibacterium ureilyticum]
MARADIKPEPDGGWSTEIVTLKNATVVPPLKSDMVQPAGILREDGKYALRGALWRGGKPITVQPDPPKGPLPELKGRWLWGGVLWAHFGHFLAESTSRLWALDRAAPLDGILFMPKRPRLGDQVHEFQRTFIALMDSDLPIRVLAEPHRVEQIVLPGQGFGLGAISAGTEPFRAAFHDRFGADVAPDGPKRLYISRSALSGKRGGMMGEEKFETYLTDHGYQVFHPQKHDMRTQIARYKAAEQVIAGDGSALHMFAMVGRPEQQVAMVLRRSSNVVGNLITHITSFTGRAPLVIKALRCEWLPPDKKRASRMSFGELDLPLLQQALRQNGFIGDGPVWEPVTDTERAQVFEDKGLTGDKAYVPWQF